MQEYANELLLPLMTFYSIKDFGLMCVYRGENIEVFCVSDRLERLITNVLV